MICKRNLILAPAAVLAALLVASCGSSNQADGEVRSVLVTASGEECLSHELPVVDLIGAADPVTMAVCQLGAIPELPDGDDAKLVIESSNPDVVDVFEGYQDELPNGEIFEIKGKGIIAVGVGTADIIITDPSGEIFFETGESFKQFRVLVTD